MRYPIYFFLVLSGFFYLTGKPLDDKAAEPVAVSDSGKGQQLEYARRINKQPVASRSTAKPVKKQVAQAKIRADKSVSREPVRKTFKVARANENSSVGVKRAVNSRSQDTNGAMVTKAAQGTKIASAATVTPTGWRTAAAQPAQNTASSGLSSTSLVGQEKAPAKTAQRKQLDWTVFGNNRAKTPGTFPTRRRTQDEVDAEYIPEEARVERRRVKRVRKKSRKYRKYRKAKRRVARKARRKRKSRARRYARVKRSNRGAYRVARRVKKKSRKKYASYRPRRKRFGFRMVAGSMSIGD